MAKELPNQKEIEKILSENAKEKITFFNIKEFKKSYPNFFEMIINSMNQFKYNSK